MLLLQKETHFIRNVFKNNMPKILTLCRIINVETLAFSCTKQQVSTVYASFK